MRRGWRPSAREGYLDVNATYGWRGVVVTGGVMLTRDGLHPYLGGGVGSPGPSGALTLSPAGVSTGWTAGLTRCDGNGASQVGLGAGGGPFVELGVGRPRGTSLTAYHVW